MRTAKRGEARGGKKPLPLLQGILPIDKSRMSTDIVAGITLAALGIPEVMGYATIAGMPVVTGLYTIHGRRGGNRRGRAGHHPGHPVVPDRPPPPRVRAQGHAADTQGPRPLEMGLL